MASFPKTNHLPLSGKVASPSPATPPKQSPIPVGHCPERSWIDLRIARSYDRMLAASSSKWAHLWADVFCRLVNTRNAGRSREQVRQLEIERGLR